LVTELKDEPVSTVAKQMLQHLSKDLPHRDNSKTQTNTAKLQHPSTGTIAKKKALLEGILRRCKIDKRRRKTKV